MQAARRRGIGLAGLALVALLAHWLAFGGLQWAWPAPTVAPTVAAVQLRVIEAPVAPNPATVPAAVAPIATPMAFAQTAEPTPPVRPSRPLSRKAGPRASSSPPEPPAARQAAVEPVQTEAAPLETLDTIPHYRTRIPPATTLHYVLLRGALRGEGDLAWAPAADGYELRLEGRVAGVAVLTQISRGAFDGAGVAPLRFTDQRLRRGTKAANFQREAGKITFSGPSIEFPLQEGAQDRLSWMIQLAAVVAAEDGLREIGAKVVLPVVGANGDLSVWAFVCNGVESLTLGGAGVAALKYVREPREPYDTQVQVWLDPARHHLPVRATQKSGPSDEGFELRLRSVD